MSEREPIAATERTLASLLTEKYGATHQDGHVWHVPVSDRGVVRLSYRLNPRYCTVSIERCYNHGHPDGRLHLGEGKSAVDPETITWPWITERVWPHVTSKDGEHSGGSYAEYVRGLERTALLGVIDEWLTQECAWGIRCDQLGYCIFCDKDPFGGQ